MQIADAFLFLIQPESMDLTDMNEDDTDVYSKLIPGNSEAELELRYLIMKNKDIFRTEYTSFEDIVHTSDVIPLVPDAKIPSRPIFLQWNSSSTVRAIIRNRGALRDHLLGRADAAELLSGFLALCFVISEIQILPQKIRISHYDCHLPISYREVST